MNHSPGTTGMAEAAVRNPLSVHINADARQVWVMLREPAKVAQWHGWDYDGLAEEIRLIFFAPGVAEGPDHLSLTLEDGDTFLVEPGDHYTLTMPDGGELTGRVWFRTARQLGLTVAQYAEHGDGLLILAEQPVVEGMRDKPSALVIASTYGLGARALHSVWDGWEALRRDSYPDADPLVTSVLNRAGKLSP